MAFQGWHLGFLKSLARYLLTLTRLGIGFILRPFEIQLDFFDSKKETKNYAENKARIPLA